MHTEKGWIPVNENYQTSDVKVFAIGDVTGLGLVTHAIGHSRLAADYINYQIMHAPRWPEIKQPIAYERIKQSTTMFAEVISRLRRKQRGACHALHAVIAACARQHATCRQ